MCTCIIPAAAAEKATQTKIDLAFPKELCNPTAAAVRLLPLEHSNRKAHKHKEQFGQPKRLCSYLWQQPKIDIWEKHKN